MDRDAESGPVPHLHWPTRQRHGPSLGVKWWTFRRQQKSPSELFAIFETHCAPRKNVTIQRKLFYEKKQSTGETIDEWITQLRLIATDCEFHNQDEMIRDMIVLNSVNKKVQERLLETDDLDLSKALKIAKIHETNIEQMKLISNTDVHYVGSRRERKPATRQMPATRKRYTAPPVRRTDGSRPKTWRSPDDAKCSNCGRIHTRQTCPLTMRLSTIAGSWTTSPQCADRQFQLKVQLDDRGNVHNECMQSTMPTTIRRTKSLQSDACQPVWIQSILEDSHIQHFTLVVIVSRWNSRWTPVLK